MIFSSFGGRLVRILKQCMVSFDSIVVMRARGIESLLKMLLSRMLFRCPSYVSFKEETWFGFLGFFAES